MMEVPEVPNFNDTPQKAIFDHHVKMLVASFVLANEEPRYSSHYNYICCGASAGPKGIIRGFTSKYSCCGKIEDSDYGNCVAWHKKDPKYYPNIDDWFRPTENEISVAMEEVRKKGYRIEWRSNSTGKAHYLGVIR